MSFRFRPHSTTTLIRTYSSNVRKKFTFSPLLKEDTERVIDFCIEIWAKENHHCQMLEIQSAQLLPVFKSLVPQCLKDHNFSIKAVENESGHLAGVRLCSVSHRDPKKRWHLPAHSLSENVIALLNIRDECRYSVLEHDLNVEKWLRTEAVVLNSDFKDYDLQKSLTGHGLNAENLKKYDIDAHCMDAEMESTKNILKSLDYAEIAITSDRQYLGYVECNPLTEYFKKI